MKILIATNAGIYTDGVDFDCYLYDLLEAAGHNPKLVLCDGILPACQMSKFPRVDPVTLAEMGQSHVCSKCFSIGLKKVGKRQIIKLSDSNISSSPAHYAADGSAIPHVDDQDALSEEILAEHAHAGAVRYFASTNLEDEPLSTNIFHKYLSAAKLTEQLYRKILEKTKPDIIIAHHGIYVPQGIVVLLAEKFSIPVLTWIKSYRKDTYLFSWGRSYHFTMQELSDDWQRFPFSESLRRQSLNYLESRRTGDRDSIHFNRNPQRISLTRSNQQMRFLVLTSVFWDAQLHYEGVLFGSQKNWLRETLRYFKTQENFELIVRVHPAEVTGAIPSREPAMHIIKEILGETTRDERGARIFVVDSNETISTYDLIEQSDCIIVYNTKTAIEAAALGKPVIVAGDSWIRGTGFDITPSSEEEYFNILNKREFSLSEYQKELAIKFFFYFYFKRMITFDISKNFLNDVSPISHSPLFDDSESELLRALRTKDEVVFPAEGFMSEQILNNLDLENILTSPFNDVSVLRTKDEIKIATSIIKAVGINTHHDYTKNWDIYGFIVNLLKTCRPNDRILDAGCGSKAALATRLVELGFNDIHGMDLKPKLEDHVPKGINYKSGDLNRTGYRNEDFDAVLMMSVIEHCGEYESVITEMSRIIKPGGRLILSTDYWYGKIDCSGIYPYGREAPEMRIFSYDEVVQMIRFCESVGLVVSHTHADFQVLEKVCRWERTNREYTFVRIIFTKR